MVEQESTVDLLFAARNRDESDLAKQLFLYLINDGNIRGEPIDFLEETLEDLGSIALLASFATTEKGLEILEENLVQFKYISIYGRQERMVEVFELLASEEMFLEQLPSTAFELGLSDDFRAACDLMRRSGWFVENYFKKDTALLVFTEPDFILKIKGFTYQMLEAVQTTLYYHSLNDQG